MYHFEIHIWDNFNISFQSKPSRYFVYLLLGYNLNMYSECIHTYTCTYVPTTYVIVISEIQNSVFLFYTMPESLYNEDSICS